MLRCIGLELLQKGFYLWVKFFQQRGNSLSSGDDFNIGNNESRQRFFFDDRRLFLPTPLK